MNCSTAPSNSRSPHHSPNHHPKEPPADGYALLVLMIMVAVMLISLTAALPSVYQQGQREREEETIFRGEQYARAIYLFHRALGRYPTSVKELLNTNGVHYLRKAYRDPLSPNGRWRFVHTNAAGILLDSWDQSVTVPNVQGTGTSGLENQSSQSGEVNGFGSQGLPNSGMNAAASPGASPNGKKKRKLPPSSCDISSKKSSSSSQTGLLLGAFIAGVAPCGDRQSIRVLNHMDHYDEWEFLGSKYATYGLPATRKTPFGQSPQPGQLGAMSQPGFSNSPQNSPSSPGFNTPTTNSNGSSPGP